MQRRLLHLLPLIVQPTLAPSAANLCASLPMVVVFPPPLTPTTRSTPGLVSPKSRAVLPPLHAATSKPMSKHPHPIAGCVTWAVLFAPLTCLRLRIWSETQPAPRRHLFSSRLTIEAFSAERISSPFFNRPAMMGSRNWSTIFSAVLGPKSAACTPRCHKLHFGCRSRVSQCHLCAGHHTFVAAQVAA